MTDDAAGFRRSLAANVIPIDWHDAIAALRASDSYRSGDHAARTLAKHPSLRVVLVAMKRDGRMQEHRAASAISVQSLEGRLCFEVGSATHELSPGQILVVTERLPHSVVAADDCAFLLTIGQHHLGDGVSRDE